MAQVAELRPLFYVKRDCLTFGQIITVPNVNFHKGKLQMFSRRYR